MIWFSVSYHNVTEMHTWVHSGDQSRIMTRSFPQLEFSEFSEYLLWWVGFGLYQQPALYLIINSFLDRLHLLHEMKVHIHSSHSSCHDLIMFSLLLHFSHLLSHEISSLHHEHFPRPVQSGNDVTSVLHIDDPLVQVDTLGEWVSQARPFAPMTSSTSNLERQVLSDVLCLRYLLFLGHLDSLSL